MEGVSGNRLTPLRERVDVDAVRATVDLVSLIGKYTALRKAGRAHVGLCPFHNEKTPSFFVYPNGRYHCFGCGAHGDCMDFVQAIDGVDFREAAARLGADTITAQSYRERIEERHKEAVAALADDMDRFPWKYLEADWQAVQDRDIARSRAENAYELTGFEKWIILRWLRDIRSEEFQNSAQAEELRGEWERSHG